MTEQFTPRPSGLDDLLGFIADNLPGRRPSAQEPADTFVVLAEVAHERGMQDAKWGEQNHPDGTGNLSQQDRAKFARKWCEDAFGAGYGTWADILTEEVAEAEGERDPARLRAELVQVAAVAVCWIEAIDRRQAQADAAAEDVEP
jgi:hypothetical protein